MLNIFGFQRKAPITLQEFCSDSSNVKGQFKSSPSTINKLSTSLTIIKGGKWRWTEKIRELSHQNGLSYEFDVRATYNGWEKIKMRREIMGAFTPRWFVFWIWCESYFKWFKKVNWRIYKYLPSHLSHLTRYLRINS